LEEPIYVELMRTASGIAGCSKCKRAKTGAVIYLVDRHLTLAAHNRIEGSYDVCKKCPREGRRHGTWDGSDKCPVIHAEVAVIKDARAQGIPTRGAIMVCTYKPCMPCASEIILAGITSVVYRDEYDGGEDVIAFLSRSGVKVRRYSGELS